MDEEAGGDAADGRRGDGAETAPASDASRDDAEAADSGGAAGSTDDVTVASSEVAEADAESPSEVAEADAESPSEVAEADAESPSEVDEPAVGSPSEVDEADDTGASSEESEPADVGASSEADESNAGPGDRAATEPMPGVPDPGAVDEDDEIPEDVRKYARFKKMDGAQYDRVNEFLRDRTYVTAREWAIARLCSDFRTETGVEMTKIGENLPELVPFMTDTYTPQAVNQARSSFEEKVRKSGATFLYGAMCDFFTAEELDDVMYEATEVAKFLLEVEGVDLTVEEELEAEERISSVMREVREASRELRDREEIDGE